MGEWLSLAWRAGRLERTAFARWQARGGLARGLAMLFVVSLLAGGVDGALWLGAHLREPSLWPRRAGLVDSLDERLARSPLPADAQRELTRNLAAWLDLQSELEALPRPLGRQAGYALEALARAMAAPYRRLGVWLPYSLLVFLAARALGGRASLPQMLGASSLYVVPHLLDLLGPVPGLGAIAGPVALCWGAAVFVKAVEVANDLDAPRAFLAATLPAMAALTLATLALSLVAILS